MIINKNLFNNINSNLPEEILETFLKLALEGISELSREILSVVFSLHHITRGSCFSKRTL